MTPSVIHVWDNAGPGLAYVAAWVCPDSPGTGCLVMCGGNSVQGGSVKAVVAAIRACGFDDPIYRNGKLIDGGL